MTSRRTGEAARNELRFVLMELSWLIVLVLVSPLTMEASPPSKVGLSATADTTMVSVSPESSAIDVGDTLSIDILVGGTEAFHAIKIILDYDETLLEVLEVTEGELMRSSGRSTFWFVVATSDTVHVDTAILGPADVRGPGRLLTVQFRAVAVGPSALTFKAIDIRDMTNTALPSRSTEGRISIVSSVRVEDSMKSYLPEGYSLAHNYPNPFNPSTQIEYSLPEETLVSLEIYNIRGQLIRSLVAEVQGAGVRTIHWDGKDESGADLASGVYFCAIRTRTFFRANRMLLVK